MARHALAKRLPLIALVSAFFNIIEFISQAHEVLGLDHFVNMVT